MSQLEKVSSQNACRRFINSISKVNWIFLNNYSVDQNYDYFLKQLLQRFYESLPYINEHLKHGNKLKWVTLGIKILSKKKITLHKLALHSNIQEQAGLDYNAEIVTYGFLST